MKKGPRGNLRLIQGNGGNAMPTAPVEQKPKPYALIGFAAVLCTAAIGALICSGIWWGASHFLVANQMMPLQTASICGAIVFGSAAWLWCHFEELERERNR
ncbi:hypothetical protein [Pseudomonas sp. UMAB-40]|uniref:hypothetical protein n=1 Tax=Pseudomonas sp. UMAB-40 TaxID=1365407 RepID=UPI001C5628C5|nr:hypothetical protein [Pseudomonas sp. UMAB-40]